MGDPSQTPRTLPATDQLRRAVELYLAAAYAAPPEPALEFLPPEQARLEEWLMSEQVQRDPPDAPLSEVRSFALRIGNDLYPHMKLRISCPPLERVYLFSVDAHDGFLQVPPGSPDHAALEELKRHNARLVSAISASWDAAGLLTERAYLRRKIEESRRKLPPSP